LELCFNKENGCIINNLRYYSLLLFNCIQNEELISQSIYGKDKYPVSGTK